MEELAVLKESAEDGDGSSAGACAAAASMREVRSLSESRRWASSSGEGRVRKSVSGEMVDWRSSPAGEDIGH